MTMSPLVELSRVLHAVRDMPEVLREVRNAIDAHTRYRTAWVFLSSDLRHLDVVGNAQDGTPFSSDVVAGVDLQEDAFLRTCLTATEPFVVDDMRTRDDAQREDVERVGVRTMMVVPLTHLPDGLRGSFQVGSFGDEGVVSPTADEVDFVHQVASLLSVVIGRLQAEQERQALEEKMRDAQRLQTLGRLSGEISHDFNNMLVAIAGNTELASMQLGEHPTQELLSEVMEAVARASDLTRQLLAFSRGQLVDKTVLNASAQIQHLSRMLVRLLPEAVSLELDLDDDAVVVADKGQLEQVVMNLVVNARDALPSGGHIRICTTRMRAALAGDDDDVVRIDVVDDGMGIAADVVPQLFQPFFSTKADGEGTGLGLAVVDTVVKSHGGRIDVDSTPGHGTRFSVLLPAAPDTLEDNDDDNDDAPSRLQGDEHVLVVDDDASIRLVLHRLLTSHGYRVSVAEDGHQALDLLDRHDDVAIVLTDLMMPRMSGEELLQVLRTRPHPPLCLAMTGYAKEMELGTTEWIAKPFAATAVLVRIRALLDAVDDTKHATDPPPTAPTAGGADESGANM